jgi:hypothetical protein
MSSLYRARFLKIGFFFYFALQIQAYHLSGSCYNYIEVGGVARDLSPYFASAMEEVNLMARLGKAYVTQEPFGRDNSRAVLFRGSEVPAMWRALWELEGNHSNTYDISKGPKLICSRALQRCATKNHLGAQT